MKKKSLILITSSFMLTSCYVHTYTVGNGPQKGMSEIAKQHNWISGLVSGKTPDHTEMAKGAEDYRITQKKTFVDGFVALITGWMYCPRTIEVER